MTLDSRMNTHFSIWGNTNTHLIVQDKFQKTPFQSSDILKLQEMAMSITEFGPSQSNNNVKILGILLFTFSLILLSKHESIVSHHE